MNPFDVVIQKKFGDVEIQAYRLKTGQLIKYGTKLAKVILPLLAEKAMQDQADVIDFSILAEMFVDNIDQLDLENLLPVLLQEATINGNPINYEEAFRGKFVLLIEVTKWLLEENFINFTDGSMQMSGFIPQ